MEPFYLGNQINTPCWYGSQEFAGPNSVVHADLFVGTLSLLCCADVSSKETTTRFTF